jgi:hypothetical protein
VLHSPLTTHHSRVTTHVSPDINHVYYNSLTHHTTGKLFKITYLAARNFELQMKLDVLAFGVHPDDVELSCAGVLLAEQLNGKKTGIIDLTQGELGTRGTAATRREEAAAAAKILGVNVRKNLGMADGFFQNDETHQRQIITVLRTYQPETVYRSRPGNLNTFSIISRINFCNPIL